MGTGDNGARRCIFIVLWDVVLYATADGDDRRGPALKLPSSMLGISKWYQLKRNRLSCPGNTLAQATNAPADDGSSDDVRARVANGAGDDSASHDLRNVLLSNVVSIS